MFLNNGVQIDELFGQLIKSGAAVGKEVEIRCLDGYELSCDVVGDLTVEAKHDLDVGYTNIETTPIDVSSLAGADETFQLRFTPGSVAGVKGFRFRYGPPATNTDEWLTVNGLGVTINGHPLLVTPSILTVNGEAVTIFGNNFTILEQ